MGKSNRRRSEPQRPSASKARPSAGSGSPQDGERIPLINEGFRQLLSVCPPRRAAWGLYTAWSEGDLAVWCDGKLADPDEYSFGVRTDVDGHERLKVRKGTDAVTTSGDRLLGIDQMARKWEVSAAGIAALRAKLSSTPEQLIAEQVAAAIAELPAPKDGIDSEAVKQLIDEKLAAAAKESQQRKRGPKTHWRLKAAGAACDFYEEHGRYPSAEELSDRCKDKLKGLLPKGRVLDDGSIYQLLRYLGAE
jgi:hypothetical protein